MQDYFSYQLIKTLLIKPFLLAGITAFVCSYFVIRFAQYFKLLDSRWLRHHPAQTHTGVVPRAGGLALFTAIFLIAFLFFPLSKPFLGIIIGAVIILVVGILDDFFDLNPFFRLGTIFLAGAVVVGFGTGISYITNPLGGVIALDSYRISFDFFGSHSIILLADIAAIVWIVWCMSMVDWSGGVDGQLPGFVGVSALVIGLLSYRSVVEQDLTQWVPATLAIIVSGAYFGFWPWNFYPQKIMPGYSGKALAGYFLAVLSIMGSAKIGAAMLVLAVPLVDAAYTILRRIASGHSPFWGDRGHLHHKLLEMGWSKRGIALFYFFISGVLGVIALTTDSFIKTAIFLATALCLLSFLLYISFKNKTFS